MRIAVVFLAFCVLSEVRVSATACELPNGCNSSSSSPSEVLCTNIKTFPRCMPDGATVLTIENSPGLRTIERVPQSVEELHISDTNLSEIDGDAFANVNLKELSIIRDHTLPSIDLGKTNSTSLLTSLILSNCTNLSKVSNVNEYTSLKVVTISFCNLKTIDDDQFENLRDLTHLDISHNHLLTYIDEDAFEDLVSMEYLDMSHCNLQKLYGEYFENAYHNNLQFVNALRNDFQCFEMCDFMKWYWGHKGFFDIGLIGSCTYHSGGTVYIYPQVYDLNRYWAGCPPIVGIVLGATLGAFFFICIVSCIVVVACGIDYRKYCCFCFESQRNRRQEEVESSANNRHGDETFTPVYNVSNEKTVIYSDAPPSYNDLNQDIQVPSNVQSQ